MFGYRVLTQTSGVPVQLSYDGSPEYNGGSVTIDWTTVTAPAGAVTLPADEITIAAGAKFLAMGQLMCRITGGASEVLTFTNTPTGGTFAVTVNAGGTTTTTAALSNAITTTNLATAINGLSNVGSGATVSGTAGTTYTIAFPAALGEVSLSADGSLLTGAGAQPATVVTPSLAIPGGYGPFDPSASDGRQTLSIGKCGLMNVTVIEKGVLGITATDNRNTNLIVGGRVWEARLIQSGVGTHSLAAGPTRAELLAALPRLMPIS